MPDPTISILLIEDNPSDALFLREALEHDPQCSCSLVIAERLSAGLELLAQRPFDIVLLDLDLPDSRGLLTLEQLRRRAPELPVVICSGFADEHAAITAVQAGAQDYIVKGPDSWGWAPRAIRYALERHQAQAILRASERRFRALIENSADVIALLDARGNILYESPAVTHVLGYQPEEMVGHNAFEFVHPDDMAISIQRSLPLFQQAQRKMTYQCRYRRKDGTWCWVEATGTNMLEEPGIQAIIINYRDITESKHAQSELLRTQQFTQATIDALSARICVLDERGYILSVNLAWRTFAETNPPAPDNAYIGTSYLEVCDHASGEHAENAGLIAEGIRAVLRGESRWFALEYPCHSPYEKRWFTVRVTRFSDDGPARLAVSHEDITERKEAQHFLEERVHERTAELEAIRQRLELATMAAGIGIWEWEVQSDRLIWDDQMLRLYGRSRDDFDGTGAFFRNSVHPDDTPTESSHMNRVIHNKEEYDSEFRVIWPDQSVHDIKAKAVALRDAGGQVERLIGVNYDITPHKQAERLQHSSEEMLRRANSELERAMRMKDEFLASMSHELRTPLNGILGFSEALQEQIYGSLNERQLRALATIESSGRHLLALINDILDISKMEAGKLRLQIELTGLNEICQASLLMIRSMAQKKSQSVGFSIDPSPLAIYADPRRLKQILVNLLDNAVKFTPEGGAIGLDVRGNDQEHQVWLTVWDRGIGINPGDLHKLFQPFIQLDSSLSRQHSGTGLGLSLAHHLAELHGGSIQVESTPGEGSRFTLSLPWTTSAEQKRLAD